MARVFTFLATGRGKEREVSQPGVVAMATRTAGPDTEQGGDNAGRRGARAYLAFFSPVRGCVEVGENNSVFFKF